MAKIDRVEDLPDWFHLEKYLGCELFGAPEWHHQISRRRAILDAHPDHTNPPRLAEQGLWFDLWRALSGVPAAEIRENPVNADGQSDYSRSGIQPVRNVYTFDLAMQAYRDEMAEREGICGPEIPNRWAAIGDKNYPLMSSVLVSNLPIEINVHDPRVPTSAVVQVDLGAPDSVLKEAFATWLKETRSQKKTENLRPGKPLYDRWSRYGILPYLDLWIWSIETSSHIPDRVMSAAISSYDAGEANLRKTIAPLAESLMRDLSGLRALAAVEASLRTPANQETSED
ncbi:MULTISPECIES: DUF6387 family protein [Pseudomonas]|uniref:DUF6387 family protein n=1 Tax=Pseudomonas TaxID=286 RepID=UPI001FF2D6D2|nr:MULTISPECIES: DUF6387 family protein [Pseudomonas]